MVRAQEKLLLRALEGERTERPPVWLMSQAGRYLREYHATRAAAGGMLDLCNSPGHAAEVTASQRRRRRTMSSPWSGKFNRGGTDPVVISCRAADR